MNAKIYIAIPLHERVAIAEHCIPTVRDGMIHGHDCLAIYGDGTELSDALVGCCDVAYRSPNIGIERQRRRHFLDFYERMDRMDWTHFYATDADALHDPSWRSELLKLQEKYDGAPVCGYNTEAHARLIGNTLEDSYLTPDVIWRQVAPGISYFLTRDHVRRVVAVLDSLPDGHWNWDWTVPAILGNRFAVSRTSYVDHIGKFGYHHPENAGWDEGDRATDPTPFLVQKRAEVVAALSYA